MQMRWKLTTRLKESENILRIAEFKILINLNDNKGTFRSDLFSVETLAVKLLC